MKKVNKEQLQWAYWWFLCLFNNKDYKAYSKAKRTSDTEAIALLEGKHSKIAQIYKDWGDLNDVLLNDIAKNGLQAWYDRNASMFEEQKHPITEIANEADISSTNLNLAISLNSNEGKTIKQVTAYIRKQYKAKRQLDNRNPPYKLYAPTNRITKSTYKVVARATDTYMLSNPLNPATKKLTAVEQVVYILNQNEEARNSATPLEARSLAHKNIWQFEWNNTLKSEYESGLNDNKVLFASQIRILRKYNNVYKHMLNGVINGKFPDLPND